VYFIEGKGKQKEKMQGIETDLMLHINDIGHIIKDIRINCTNW